MTSSDERSFSAFATIFKLKRSKWQEFCQGIIKFLFMYQNTIQEDPSLTMIIAAGNPNQLIYLLDKKMKSKGTRAYVVHSRRLHNYNKRNSKHLEENHGHAYDITFAIRFETESDSEGFRKYVLNPVSIPVSTQHHNTPKQSIRATNSNQNGNASPVPPRLNPRSSVHSNAATYSGSVLDINMHGTSNTISNMKIKDRTIAKLNPSTNGNVNYNYNINNRNGNYSDYNNNSISNINGSKSTMFEANPCSILEYSTSDRTWHQEFRGNVQFIYDPITYYLYLVTIGITGKKIIRRLDSNIKSKRATKAYIVTIKNSNSNLNSNKKNGFQNKKGKKDLELAVRFDTNTDSQAFRKFIETIKHNKLGIGDKRYNDNNNNNNSDSGLTSNWAEFRVVAANMKLFKDSQLKLLDSTARLIAQGSTVFGKFINIVNDNYNDHDVVAVCLGPPHNLYVSKKDLQLVQNPSIIPNGKSLYVLHGTCMFSIICIYTVLTFFFSLLKICLLFFLLI